VVKMSVLAWTHTVALYGSMVRITEIQEFNIMTLQAYRVLKLYQKCSLDHSVLPK
jgi:hypothetical protein